MSGRYAEWISKTSHDLASLLIGSEEDLIDRADEVDVIVQEVVRGLARAVVSLLFERLARWSIRRSHGSGWEVLRRHSVEVIILFGTVAVMSPYLYNRARREGRRPVYEQLGLSDRHRTTAVERALTDFGAEESFVQASRRFEEHYGFSVGSTTSRNMMLKRARQAEEFTERRLAEADRLLELSPRERPGCDTLLAGLDGSMLRTGVLQPLVPGEEKRRRLEAWREVRLGFVRKPDEVDKTYVLRMDSYEEVVGQLLCPS